MKPRRTILSVPGHVEKMHAKAAGSTADVVMLDLEDSVPLDAKTAARQQIIRSLQQIDWRDKVVAVRINGLDTAFAYRDILEIVEAAGSRLDAMVVPKVDHPGDIYFADRLLFGIERSRGFPSEIRLEASIETARGLANVMEIATSSHRLISLVFGIADFSASIGARLVSISGHGEGEADIYPGHRWHFAISRMVMAAKSNGLLVIDAPFGNFKDSEGLERSAAMACALGCDGKWAIHPGQLGTINKVFTPSREDIQRAVQVIEAFDAAETAGRGAVAVDGRMVDQATVRLARRLYEQAKFLNLI